MKKIFIFFFGLSIQIIFSQCWVGIKSNGFNTVGTTLSGDIYVWGANNYGQLGNGTTAPISNLLNFSNQTIWKDISISETSFGIKNDGTLWVWGSDALLPIPNPQTLPIQLGTDNDWKKVSCRYSQPNTTRSLALKTNGTLWDLGNLGAGNIITQVGTDNDWKDIFTGNGFSFAIKNNGTLWGWGYNQGWLGDGTTTDKILPVQIGTDNDWKTISTSDYFVIALKNNNTLWGWGGLNLIGFSSIPIQISTDFDWKEIATFNGGFIALKNNGTLWGQGYNWYGSFGNGTNTDLTSLSQIGTDTNWLSISAGSAHVTALKNDNSLWAWGAIYNGGTLGNGTTTSNVPIQIYCSSTLSSNIAQNKEIFIYPNPTKDKIYFKDLKNISKVNIYDVKGRLIKFSLSKNNYTDLSSFNKGIYYVEVFSEGKSYKTKVIKE